MSASEEPRFETDVAEYLGNEENYSKIEELKNLSVEFNVRVERAVLKLRQEQQDKLKEKLKSVPGFWPKVLTRSLQFRQVCNVREDLDALSYLTGVEVVTDWRDGRVFDLVFTFAENPYFSDDKLVKHYVLNDKKTFEERQKEGLIAKEDDFSEDLTEFSESELETLPTEIHWKSDEKNLCKKLPRNNESGEEDEFEGDPGSFFHYFTESPEDTFGLGVHIRDEIIPHCVDHFLGLTADDDDDEFDEEDEEDDEDADEIDLEEEENRPAKKKARRG